MQSDKTTGSLRFVKVQHWKALELNRTATPTQKSDHNVHIFHRLTTGSATTSLNLVIIPTSHSKIDQFHLNVKTFQTIPQVHWRAVSG